MMNLEGKKVVVVGLALTGVAVAKFCVRRGARVVVTVGKPAGKLAEQMKLLAGVPVTWELGGHRDATFTSADLVVMSPGVPTLPEMRAARAAGVEVIAEIELGYRFLDPGATLIAITGTNGKSTTTALTGALCAASGRPSFCGGNLGNMPLIDAVDHPANVPGGWIVAEVGADFTKYGKVERVTMSKIREKTATHLSYAWAVIPHVTQFDKTDITEFEKVRKELSKKVEEHGAKLTVTGILIKIIAEGLKKFPQFNSSIDMDKMEVIYKKYINIGVAVDTEYGLLVPVIKNADKKNLIEISVELNQLAQKARDKKLSLEEMQGGCFTITNLGGIGGTYFTPIINSPEVAILGVSRGNYEPVAPLVEPMASQAPQRAVGGRRDLCNARVCCCDAGFFVAQRELDRVVAKHAAAIGLEGGEPDTGQSPTGIDWLLVDVSGGDLRTAVWVASRSAAEVICWGMTRARVEQIKGEVMKRIVGDAGNERRLLTWRHLLAP